MHAIGVYVLWIVLAVIFAAIYFLGTHSCAGDRGMKPSGLGKGKRADGE